MVNMKAIYEMIIPDEKEIVEIMHKKTVYEKEIKELRADKEHLLNEYLIHTSTIKELKARNNDLQNMYDEYKKKSKTKRKKEKLQLMAEILYYKSKSDESTKVYMIQKDKPQDIVNN